MFGAAEMNCTTVEVPRTAYAGWPFGNYASSTISYFSQTPLEF